MKIILVLIISCFFILTFTACSDNSNDDTTDLIIEHKTQIAIKGISGEEAAKMLEETDE